MAWGVWHTAKANTQAIMKHFIASICLLMLPATSWAGYRIWTNAEGQTAELELLSVEQQGDQQVGKFKMKDGRTVKLKASQLSNADAELLANWKPEAAASAVSTKESVFDELKHSVSERSFRLRRNIGHQFFF